MLSRLKKENLKKTQLIIQMIGDFFLFFFGLIACCCFFGRVCYEGDYDDYD